METTIREFIRQREAQVRKQISALEAELRELAAAREAIDGGKVADVQPTNAQAGKRTIKGMIRSVLTDHPEGGVAEHIIEWVQATYGVEVPRSSMSPQLSRLKAEGVLYLDSVTKVWRLAKYARDAAQRDGLPFSENEATTGASEANAEDADTSSAFSPFD
jgi:hypothetical protein